MITRGPYTTLARELQNLFDGLSLRQPQRVRVAVLSRFHGFTDRQVLELMDAWEERYSIPLALDYFSLVGNRISAEWAGYIRERIRQAQARFHREEIARFEAAAADARAARAAAFEAVMQERLAQERASASRPFFSHLLHNYDRRSEDEQAAIRGLIYFVTTQPERIPVPNSSFELNPGERYSWAGNRWLLGRAYGQRGAVLVWLEGDINGEITLTDLTSFREDIARGAEAAADVAAVWIPWGRAIALACAVVMLPLAAPAAAAPAAESAIGWAVGASRISWLFSGSRLIAGSTNAALNLITQAIDHGFDLSRYNWGSVGADYVIGAISQGFARAVITRLPVSGRLTHFSTWRMLWRQQSIFFVYGTIVGALRSQIGRTPRSETIGVQYAEGTLQMAKSVAIQQFVTRTAAGASLFPGGLDQALHDPRLIVISRLFSFVIRLALRTAFDVTPRSEEVEAAAVAEAE